MLTTIRGLSLEPPPAEAEFLRRELGISWEQVNESQIESAARSAKRTLLMISEPDPYRRVVARVPKDSIITFLVSDEAYSVARLELVRAPSVHRVYRHYAAAPAPLAAVVAAVWGFVTDARKTGAPARTVVPNVQSGWQVRKRMLQWRLLGKGLVPVPLGYTDTFARAYGSRHHLDDDTSLFNFGEQMMLRRSISIAFRGNRGLAQRVVGCELAKAVPKSSIFLVDADWSARGAPSAGGPYIEQLESAAFALCPPGFANNESFRYYEALICGAFPLELAVATTHLGVLPWRDGVWVPRSSWEDSLRLALAMTEVERVEYVHRARNAIVCHLRAVAENLRADLEEE